MAKRHQKGRVKDRTEEARQVEKAGEAGGFPEEAPRDEVRIPTDEEYPGRTIGDTATSYSSVGGAEDPDEWPVRVPEPDDNAPDYETPGGAQPDQPGSQSGPVHDVSFRPAPGGYVESRGRGGRNIPYTGEVISTRDSTFEEDPDTGRTADEEEGEMIRESLEERTRGYESG